LVVCRFVDLVRHLGAHLALAALHLGTLLLLLDGLLHRNGFDRDVSETDFESVHAEALGAVGSVESGDLLVLDQEFVVELDCEFVGFARNPDWLPEFELEALIQLHTQEFFGDEHVLHNQEFVLLLAFAQRHELGRVGSLVLEGQVGRPDVAVQEHTGRHDAVVVAPEQAVFEDRQLGGGGLAVEEGRDACIEEHLLFACFGAAVLELARLEYASAFDVVVSHRDGHVEFLTLPSAFG